MKKSRLFALMAAAGLVAYPAVSWLLGQKIETALENQYKEIEGHPYVKVVRREFDRGVFSSTETVTFELFDKLPGMEARKAGADDEDVEVFGAEPEDGSTPLRLTVRSSIKHGPLPGFTAVAAAVADSTVTLDGEAGEEVARILKGDAPLSARTVFAFDGSGNTTLGSPAFSSTVDDPDGEAVQISSAGLKASMNFSSGFKRYTVTGEAPRFEVRQGDATRFALSALKFEGEQQRVFDDEPVLLTGTQRVTVGEIGITPQEGEGTPVMVKGITYDVSTPLKGEFIDVEAKLGAKVMEVGGRDFGPAHYDISLHHLHARSAARLYRALSSLHAEQAAEKTAADGLAALSEPAAALLSQGAELRLDRISFTTPDGEAKVSARASFKDLKAEEFGNPFLLLERLDFSGEIGLPETLLDILSASGAGTSDADEDEDLAPKRPGSNFRRQVAALVSQGYLEREGGRIMTRVEFSNGRLTANGRPLNPLAMAGAGAAAAPDEPDDLDDLEDLDDPDELSLE